MELIRAALETFGLIENFSVLHSAEAEGEGKPHPAVYLSAMSRLGVDPKNCIAFEDSAVGVRAAKSAGAWVIAVPDHGRHFQSGVRRCQCRALVVNEFFDGLCAVI